MFYYVYKITNLCNHRIYIGCHKTDNLDDGYMGSGKLISHAIQKYGLENFQKEILFMCNSLEEMFAKEAELVNESFIAREDTYNICIGGFGGARPHVKTKEYKNKMSLIFKGRRSPTKNSKWINNGEVSKMIPKDDPIPENWFAGRCNKDRQSISKANLGQKRPDWMKQRMSESRLNYYKNQRLAA